MRLEFGHTVAGQRRDEENLVKLALSGEFLGTCQHRFLGGFIDLVEHQDLAFRTLLERFENGFKVIDPLLAGVDHEQDCVGFLRTVPGGADHGAVKPPLGRKDAGCVGKDDLRFAFQRDADYFYLF